MNKRAETLNRILVIKLGALGDFVLACAAMARVREFHPDAQIDLLTTPAYEALGRSSPYFDTVFTDGRPEGFSAWTRLIARLRAARYQRVYDLQTNDRSGLLFQALRPFPPQWSGIAPGCSHPHRNRDRDFMHTLERQAEQLKDAGIWPEAPVVAGTAPPPNLRWMSMRGSSRVSAVAESGRPVALLVPGGSEHRPEKRWPIDRFASLAASLVKQQYDVSVIGGAQEGPLARLIMRQVSEVRDLTGRTDFMQLGALGARAALAVGNDTGPMHVLAASGTPSIVLFSGASDPMLTAPRGDVIVVSSSDLADLEVSAVEQALRALKPN